MFQPGPALFIFSSPVDILVVLVIAVLLFGGKKIPELAKGLGEGIKNFKGSVKSDEEPKSKPEPVKIEEVNTKPRE